MATVLSTTQDSVTNLCYYVNETRQIQVLRVITAGKIRMERVVFPGQRLLFEALLIDQLAVHTNDSAESTQCKTLSCAELRVKVLEEVGISEAINASAR